MNHDEQLPPRCIVLPDTGETTGEYTITRDGTVVSHKRPREPRVIEPSVLPSGAGRVWLRCYDRRRGYLVRDLVRSTWPGDFAE